MASEGTHDQSAMAPEGRGVAGAALIRRFLVSLAVTTSGDDGIEGGAYANHAQDYWEMPSMGRVSLGSDKREELKCRRLQS